MGEAIRSCLDQTHTKIEIIVIDDGSTDRSLEVIKSFGKNIQWETGPNRGGNHARNRGFALSQGEYIQYLDADDILHPNKIASQVRVLTGASQTEVSSCAWARFHNTVSEARLISRRDWCDLLPIDWLLLAWGGGGTMPVHAWLTPRQLITTAGLWNEELRILQDSEFFTRVLLKATNIRFSSDAIAFYRSGYDGTISRGGNTAALRSWHQVLDLTQARLLQAEDSSRVKRACANAYRTFMYSAYPDAPDLVRSAEATIKSLGGCDPPRKGDIRFRIACKLFGWKFTRRLQHTYRARRRPRGLTSF